MLTANPNRRMRVLHRTRFEVDPVKTVEFAIVGWVRIGPGDLHYVEILVGHLPSRSEVRQVERLEFLMHPNLHHSPASRGHPREHPSLRSTSP